MPKIVDHAQRRRELADAAWRVAVRAGLDDLTLRAVATEAGVSTGVLAHYFADKEALIVHALHTAIDRLTARYTEQVATLGPWETLRAALAEVLLLDDERRAEWRTWLNFWDLALTSPVLAAEQNRWYTGWRDYLAALVRRCQQAGTIAPARDPADEAIMAIAFVDGLCLQAAFDPGQFTAARQLALLDRYLGGLASRES
jgi:AcrR family transcriptional regulator